METRSLRTSLEQIESGEMSTDEFVRIVFGSEEHMLSLVQRACAARISMNSAEVSSFVRADLNPDLVPLGLRVRG